MPSLTDLFQPRAEPSLTPRKPVGVVGQHHQPPSSLPRVWEPSLKAPTREEVVAIRYHKQTNTFSIREGKHPPMQGHLLPHHSVKRHTGRLLSPSFTRCKQLQTGYERVQSLGATWGSGEGSAAPSILIHSLVCLFTVDNHGVPTVPGTAPGGQTLDSALTQPPSLEDSDCMFGNNRTS